MLQPVETCGVLWLTALICSTNSQIVEVGPPSPINRQDEQQAVRTGKAREVLKYMNLTADPCNDFHDFACGNWIKEGESTTMQSQLELHVNKDLQLILDEPVTTQDGESARKIKNLYKACLAVEKTSSLQHNFLINFIKKHGGLASVAGTNWQIATYNWIQVIAMLRANYDMEILVGLDVDTNLHTLRGNSIYLREPKSTLIPVELCSAIAARQVDARDKVYDVIQKNVSDNMQSWLSLRETEANRLAGDIVRFEFELCKQMRKEQTIPPSSYDENEEVEEATGNNKRGAAAFRTSGQNRLHGNRQNTQYPRHSLHQLTELFGGVINFKQFLDIRFDASISDLIYMRSEAYFHHLARTIKASTKPTLSYYIMYRALTVLNFPTTTDDNMIRRTKYCVQLIQRYFPKVIGEIYNSKFHRSVSRSDVELLFGEITKAFESLKVDLLDENTKRAAKQKLAQFKVSFPIYRNPTDMSDLPIENLDYWRKLELVMQYSAKKEQERFYSVNLKSRSYSVEAPEVRMQLVPMESEILIGWGLLQPPFYHYNYPKSLKLSLLGQRLCAQLMAAFYEQQQGGWNHNSPSSPMRFRNVSECFRMQISNYMHNNPETFRNASKLRELVADSSALKIAFSSYLTWLDSIDPTANRVALSKETLPEVNFTNTQLFFINFAQTRCAARHNDHHHQLPPEFLPMDRHTIERYDVNGPLTNCVEFAREFGCAAGTDMNPDEKCVV